MKRKILAVGCGGIGERHIRVLSGMEDIDLSICDINSELLDRLKKTYKISNTFCSWSNIDLERFDSVVISTPANLHVRMIMDSLEAKCHVLCEKPLALSPEGIDRAIELTRKNNRTVGVAYIYRSMPGLKILRDRIVSGEIGAIKSVVCVVGSDYSFFRPDYKKIYYSDPSKGGGALHDAVSHMVNYIEWCLGPMDSIYCLARHLVLPGVEVEDTAACVMTFTDTEAIGTLSLNQFQCTYGVMFEFAGTAGVLKFDGTSHSIGVCRETCGEFSWSKAMNLSRDEYHKLQFENFFKAVDTREPFICTLEDAETTMRTILAAHESVRQHRPVSVLNQTSMPQLSR
jgi:predicted dehydrogenase